MYFVMRDIHEHGRTCVRRIGKAMIGLTPAKKLAWKHRGYVMDDKGFIVAQATDPEFLKYIGDIRGYT